MDVSLNLTGAYWIWYNFAFAHICAIPQIREVQMQMFVTDTLADMPCVTALEMADPPLREALEKYGLSHPRELAPSVNVRIYEQAFIDAMTENLLALGDVGTADHIARSFTNRVFVRAVYQARSVAACM
jgi:hypothetical protein